MINLIYQLLVRMGYTHPIHAPLASLPPGLAVGALLFSLAALIFQRTNLMQTARHCTILFFVLLFPVALTGYLDWQHYYAGAWLFPIRIKVVLTLGLLILIPIGLIFGRTQEQKAP